MERHRGAKGGQGGVSDWGSVLGGVGLAAKGQCSGGWGLRAGTIGVVGQVDVRG